MSEKVLWSNVQRPDGQHYEKGDWRQLPEIVHDEHAIKGFFGDYYWLSNFGISPVVLGGVPYKSVERAYQAAKWQSEDRRFFEDCTNDEAILHNRENMPNEYTPEDWDAVKLSIMEELLVQKFDATTNPENHQKLLATGEKYLEETNWWNDTFWGKNLEGEGENHLGVLLMKVRANLRSAATTGQ